MYRIITCTSFLFFIQTLRSIIISFTFYNKILSIYFEAWTSTIIFLVSVLTSQRINIIINDITCKFSIDWIKREHFAHKKHETGNFPMRTYYSERGSSLWINLVIVYTVIKFSTSFWDSFYFQYLFWGIMLYKTYYRR